MRAKVAIDQQQIADFCRRHRVRKLALFGSVLRDDFRSDSDIDVLVEFDPGASAGFMRLAAMEQELSAILCRRVDLRTPAELSRYFRDEVVRTAEIQYAQG
jgi:predicted nucleotidyltransferase